MSSLHEIDIASIMNKIKINKININESFDQFTEGLFIFYHKKTLCGDRFNRLFSRFSFVKLTNSQETHNGFEFKDGMNIDHNPFNSTDSCQPGGIYFTELNKLAKWIDYNGHMKYVRHVTIPDDAIVYIEYDKLKTDKIILGERQKISEHTVWEDEKYCTHAVEQNGIALKYVKNQTDDICKIAFKFYYKVLQIVKNRTNNIRNDVMTTQGFTSSHQKKCLAQINDFCNKIIHPNCFAFRYTSNRKCLKIKEKVIVILRCVKNQTDNICMEAVKMNGNALEYVKNQTEDICIEAVKQCGNALHYVKNQTDDICMEAVRQTGFALYYVKKQTKDICIEAIKKYYYPLRYVKNQTDDICIEAVKRNGLALQFVKDLTDEICMEAVKQNGNALKYVKNQTDDICIEAVKKCDYALRFVKNQTDDICIEAVKRNGMALRYVKKQTDEICIEALKQNNEAIKYVKNQTNEIRIEVVKQNSMAWWYVNDQTKKIC